ncbi:MAG: YicC/YloC family endoribonuclease [Candidatus Babeliales bacterium]
MITSMTGFATKTVTVQDAHGNQTQISLSIKSLNGRYLEATCRLPLALSNLETECIKVFKQKLHRGSITFLVQLSNPAIFQGSLQANSTLAQEYTQALKKIQETCSLPGTISINDMIHFEDLFISQEQPIDEHIKTIFFKTLDEVITLLKEVRSVEGKALEKDLLERAATMQKNITVIEKAAAQSLNKKKIEITKKFEELGNNTHELVEMQRAALFLELDKMDIHEEIVRFKNHVVTFKNTIDSQEQEKGRRLDFILQELAREINTIAAKCNDSEISSLAINIKVEVEKAREQVQNIV